MENCKVRKLNIVNNETTNYEIVERDTFLPSINVSSAL